MVPDLRLESSPVGHPFRFLFPTNENICDGPLMTRSESSSFLHFKNLEVNGNTFGLLSSQLSSVDQKTSRTGRLMEERSQLEKSPMMLTNRWVNKKETADCIGKHNTGYKDGKRLREDTLTLSLSLSRSLSTEAFSHFSSNFVSAKLAFHTPIPLHYLSIKPPRLYLIFIRVLDDI